MPLDVSKYKTHNKPKQPNYIVVGTVVAFCVFGYGILLAYNTQLASIVYYIFAAISIPIILTLHKNIKDKQQKIDNLFESKYKEFESELRKHVQSRKQ